MEALVRCPRCWKRVPASARFCRRCGGSLHHAAIAPPQPPEPSDSDGAVVGSGLAALLSFVLMGAVSLIGIALFSMAVHSGGRCPAGPGYFETDPSYAPAVRPVPDRSWRHEFGTHHLRLYQHSWDPPREELRNAD